MVPFAGYSMPLIYKDQTHIESHNWTRNNAGLFDVSHMLQSKLVGPGSVSFLNRITPTDFGALPRGYSHLSVFLNHEGGIIDDTIISKNCNDDDFTMVTNAGRVKEDSTFLKSELKLCHFDCNWESVNDRALLALQGPKSKDILEPLLMEGQTLTNFFFGERKLFQLYNGVTIDISRSGYTGEDGFEMSVPEKNASEFASLLLDNSTVKPIGLAARDSLRLEAGMCLYGNELNEEITPVEARLNWIISKTRRNLPQENERFNGYEKIMTQLNEKKYEKLRVGFKYTKKGPAARTGSLIFSSDGITQVGIVTSGSASPSLNNINIGQGYVDTGMYKNGSELFVQVRNKLFPIEIVKMPIVPTNYYKK